MKVNDLTKKTRTIPTDKDFEVLRKELLTLREKDKALIKSRGTLLKKIPKNIQSMPVEELRNVIGEFVFHIRDLVNFISDLYEVYYKTLEYFSQEIIMMNAE